MRVLLTALMSLAFLTAAQGAEGKMVDAFSGDPTYFYSLYALGLNCLPVPNGEFHITVPVKPAHGKIYWVNALVVPRFPPSNPRHVCNSTGRHGLQLVYQSDAGYKGPDKFSVQVTYPAGLVQDISRPVTVH